jgi:hypothetical protein
MIENRGVPGPTGENSGGHLTPEAKISMAVALTALGSRRDLQTYYFSMVEKANKGDMKAIVSILPFATTLSTLIDRTENVARLRAVRTDSTRPTHEEWGAVGMALQALSFRKDVQMYYDLAVEKAARGDKEAIAIILPFARALAKIIIDAIAQTRE